MVLALVLLANVAIVVVTVIRFGADSFAIIAVTFVVAGFRTLFLIIKWFRGRWWWLVDLLMSGVVATLASFTLVVSDEATKVFVIPILFWTSHTALILGIFTTLLDAFRVQSSVWMWEERNWPSLNDDIESSGTNTPSPQKTTLGRLSGVAVSPKKHGIAIYFKKNVHRIEAIDEWGSNNASKSGEPPTTFVQESLRLGFLRTGVPRPLHRELLQGILNLGAATHAQINRSESPA